MVILQEQDQEYVYSAPQVHTDVVINLVVVTVTPDCMHHLHQEVVNLAHQVQ